MRYAFLSLCCLAFLSACGGGGGESVSTQASAKPNLKTVPKALQDAVKKAKIREVWPNEKPEEMTYTEGNQTFHQYDKIDFGGYPLGSNKIESAFDNQGEIEKGYSKIYQMPYSLTMIDVTTEYFNKKTQKRDTLSQAAREDFNITVLGLRTETLPKNTAEYRGVGMDADNEGILTMKVDFDNQAVLSGSITGLTYGDITFERGKIQPVTVEDVFDYPNVTSIGFVGKAKIAQKAGVNAQYAGQFFGPNAEEVAGGVFEKIPNYPEGQDIYNSDAYKAHAAFGGEKQ